MALKLQRGNGAGLVGMGKMVNGPVRTWLSTVQDIPHRHCSRCHVALRGHGSLAGCALVVVFAVFGGGLSHRIHGGHLVRGRTRVCGCVCAVTLAVYLVGS